MIEKLIPAFTTVAVGGFESNSGKTTLVCDLLRAFPGWEAIKVTRGHFRSCGKDPQACCVSALLGPEPIIRSGRDETYAHGKDTGRFWDSGASNVHWVIATDKQIEKGIDEALRRVEASGVLIEGNSYLKFVDVDFAIMVTLGEKQRIKPSARRVMSKADALYLNRNGAAAADNPSDHSSGAAPHEFAMNLPVYVPSTLGQLVAEIKRIHRFTT